MGKKQAEIDQVATVADKTDLAKERRNVRSKSMRDASQRVAKYLAENSKGLPEDILADVKVLMPRRAAKGTGTPRVNNVAFFLELFKKKKTITEEELYSELGLTRPSMGTKRASAIRQAKTPEERVWISFDKSKGIYKFLGQGANPPAGYDGPLPVDKA